MTRPTSEVKADMVLAEATLAVGRTDQMVALLEALHEELLRARMAEAGVSE